MTSIEESLRGAFREVAGEVPADSVPPLILPARQPRWAWLIHEGAGVSGRQRPGAAQRRQAGVWGIREAAPPRPGRARAWAAVASSAVMVAVLIGAATSLGSVLHGRETVGLSRGGSSGGSAGAALGVPRYYVALTALAGVRRIKARPRASAVVRATATGATIATVEPPRPFDTFTMVTAARDDRTFVLAAERFPPAPRVRLYVLRLHPQRRAPESRAQLAAVPAADLAQGTRAFGLALSPDGRQLALTVGTSAPQDLQVIDLATGTQRTWTGASACPSCDLTSLGSGSGDGWLSWTTDEHTLAIAGADSVRLLDTAASGADLLADSRPVGAVGKSSSTWHEVVPTPDQHALVVVRQLTLKTRLGHTAPTGQELLRLSASTGQATTVFNQLPVRQSGYEQVLWTSRSGELLIVTGAQPGASAGILRGPRYTPIPWSSGVLTAAW